mgnify:FL=1
MEVVEDEEMRRHRELMAVMDKVNDKYGRATVHTAAQGNPRVFWRMRRERMSPHYTTRWGDIPWIK